MNEKAQQILDRLQNLDLSDLPGGSLSLSLPIPYSVLNCFLKEANQEPFKNFKLRGAPDSTLNLDFEVNQFPVSGKRTYTFRIENEVNRHNMNLVVRLVSGLWKVDGVLLALAQKHINEKARKYATLQIQCGNDTITVSLKAVLKDLGLKNLMPYISSLRFETDHNMIKSFWN